MARKLPWTVGTSQKIESPSERRKIQMSPNRGQSTGQRTKASPAKVSEEPSETQHKRPASRSPPSSPVRAPDEPVPKVEPMQTGLDGDDRYIMVEDEFAAVAKTFTAHLHAAEYGRLRRKAKDAPPKPLPDITNNMTSAGRLNLERKKLHSKQTSTLKDISKGGKSTRRTHGDRAHNDEVEQEEEESKIDDLWSGTSLAGLMEENNSTNDNGNNNQKPSLVGLQRLNSSTRASKGFGRGETETSPKRQRKMILDVFDPHDEDETTVVTHKQPPPPPSRAPQPRSVPSSSTSNTKHETPSTTTRSNRPPPAQSSTTKTRRRNRIDDLDDFDESQFPPPASVSEPSRIKTEPSSSSTSSSVKRPNVAKRNATCTKQRQKDRRSRLDEVPVLLV